MDLPKPLGLKFARGNDGGAYVVENNPAVGNTDPRIQVRAFAEGTLTFGRLARHLHCTAMPHWQQPDARSRCFFLQHMMLRLLRLC